MKLSLETLLPHSATPVDADTLVRFQKFYAERLRKYGLNDWPDEQVSQLADWCARLYGHRKAGWACPPGLAMWGSLGTGKSTAAKIVSALFSLSYYEMERRVACAVAG